MSRQRQGTDRGEDLYPNTTPMHLLPMSDNEKETDDECLSPEKMALAPNNAVYNQLNGSPTAAGEKGVIEGDGGDKSRETWDKKIDFLLSVIGFAVDLGNVWRFPYICFRNGGGAFLIPYSIMYIFGGLPLFYLELALGQYQRAGCITVWKRICPMFKGIGFGIIIIASYTAFYYSTVVSWALFYMLNSFKTSVPWDSCGNVWNSNSCLANSGQENQTYMNYTALFNISVTSATEEYFFGRVLQLKEYNNIDNLGKVQWEIALCLLVIFTIVYFSMWKGVKSSGKAVWITATAPYVVLIILLIVGLRLKGSKDGIVYFLKPDLDKLKDRMVWVDAAAQIFFSLGPGFGVLLALSSYNKFRNNCYSDAMVTSLINCLTSLLAGFVVFSVLGHMAYKMDKDIDKVATEGPGLVFIAYPQAIAMLPVAPLWGVLFFLMLITLGLDSTFGGLEAIITGILDFWPVLKKRREWFVLGLIVYCYLGSLPTTTEGGYIWLTWLDQHGAPIAILFIVFCETVALNWFYGVRRFAGDIKTMLGFTPGIFWRACWFCISPLFLLFIFVLTCEGFSYNPPLIMGKVYIAPYWTKILGVFIIGSSISFVPMGMLLTYLQCSGTPAERFRQMIKPEERPPPKEITIINQTIELDMI